jgi:MFS family permease
LSLLYAAVFLTRIGFGTILIIFPNKGYLNVGSSALVGLIIALYPFVEGVSALPVGTYIDRKGRRSAFVIGMALISVLTLVLGLTNNVVIVGPAHAIMGLSAALVTIASLTMITDLTGEKNRGIGMGTFNLANLLGYGVGVTLGLIFSTIFPTSLADSFLVVAPIFGLATVFVYFLLREPPHATSPRLSLREMFHSLTGEMSAIFPLWFSLTVIVGLYFFLPRLASGISSPTGQSLVTTSTIPLILFGLGIIGAGSVFFGRLSDKIGRMRTILIGVIGEIGFLLVFPPLFQELIQVPQGEGIFQGFIAAFQQAGAYAIAGGILFFLGSALIPTILAYVGDKAAKDYRGAAMGLYSLMLSAGIALGNLLAGVADEIGSQGGLNPPAGIQAVFYTGVIIFSTLSLTTGILLRRNRLMPAQPSLPQQETRPL